MLRLAAQDVIVTDPAWFDAENPPADQPPQFKRRPKLELPDELKKKDQIVYVIVDQIIGDKGERLHYNPLCSNPYVEKAIAVDYTFSSAMRGAKPVAAHCWFAIIFNPVSAKRDGGDSSPRLLAVAPVLFDKKAPAIGGPFPPVIWATLNLDEKGQLQNFVFDEAAFEVLRPQVGASLHGWRFAPARRGEQATAANLRVPLILEQPNESKMPDVLPKAVYRVRPKYPIAMIRSGLRGEVVLQFTVDETGAVKDPVVLRSSNPYFNQGALEALSQWKFEPGRLGGEPVAAKMQQPFVFEFGDGSGRDLVSATKVSPDDQRKLPPELRYDEPPRLKGVLDPVYPYALLHGRVEGHANVAFRVNELGKVCQLSVTESSRPEFGYAVAALVEASEFMPALKNGKPTNAVLRFEQKFEWFAFWAVLTDREKREVDLLSLEEKHPEKIFSAKKLDAPLKPIFQRAPVFPSSVTGRLSRGDAKIEILIDEEGSVHLARIVDTTDPAFGYAAVQAVSDWRFEPPKVRGKPVLARVKVPFEFKSATSETEAVAAEKRADEAEGKQQ